MEEKFSRIGLLIGEENLNKLKGKHVALFGVGGVGGFVLEGLARSGIGTITMIDGDTVEESNLNRQIISTVDNIGTDKVVAAKKRVVSINPDITVKTKKIFFLPENADGIDFSEFDYVVDAIDTVSAKIAIIEQAKKSGVPVISCMGTGGKLNPEKLTVCDITKTQYCPLARVMRRELAKRNIKDVKVVYSPEECVLAARTDNKKVIPSMIFVPAVAGLLIAKEVISDLIYRED